MEARRKKALRGAPGEPRPGTLADCACPTAADKTVVRPNVDTLYSVAFLDLSAEPVVIHVPNTDGRYYVMQMMDANTNVFAAPGKRTTGTGAHDFVVIGPRWRKAISLGMTMTAIHSPTNTVSFKFIRPWVVASKRRTASLR